MNTNVITNHPGFLVFGKSNVGSKSEANEISEKEKQEMKEEMMNNIKEEDK